MRLRIIDLARISTEDVETVNKCFDLWHNTFAPILNESHETLEPEYFWKSRNLTCLVDEQNVAGLTLGNFLDLQCRGVLDLKYLADASEILRGRMRNQFKNLYTVEWVTVDRSYQKRNRKVRYYDVLIGAAFEEMRRLKMSSAIGFSRTDLKLDKRVEKFGGYAAEKSVRHDIEVAVMLIERVRLARHPDENTAQMIDQLFNEYLNEGGLDEGGIAKLG